MNLAKIRLIVAWSLVGLLLLWCFLNRTPVEVDFLIFPIRMPLAMVIILSAGLGAGAVFAFKYIKKLKQSGDEPAK